MVVAQIPPEPEELQAKDEIRLQLVQRGYNPLAVLTRDKLPLGKDWRNRALLDPPEVTRFPCVSHAMSTGVLADGLQLADVDVDDPDLTRRIRELFQTKLGDTLIRHRSNSARFMMPYRSVEPKAKKRAIAGPKGRVEFLTNGQMAVVDGIHPSGVPYEWTPVPPWKMAVDDLPRVTEQQLDEICDALAPMLGIEPAGHKSNGAATIESDTHVPTELLGVDVAAALEDIANGTGSHDAQVRLAGRWAALGMPSSDAVAMITSAFLRRPDSKRDVGWRKAMAEIPRLVEWAYEQEAALAAAPPPPPVSPPTPPAGAGPGPSQPPDLDLDASPVPAYSDEHLALLFAEQHAERLRHVAAWSRWFVWTGAFWRADETLRSFSLARLLLRQTAASCKKRRLAPAIAGSRTVAAVERLARADRRLAATVDQWDSDPTLLNTPGGVVDLRTGQLRPHRIVDYMSKMTAVAPGGDCPTWLAFLDRISNKDQDLQAFLQRVAGYCLTGSTREHVLFFGYGLGRNGKGTFIGALDGIMGSYAATAGMETFTYSTSDRHPCDLALLRGARLVTAQETEDGRRWAESRIKMMTGGDKISARFIGQNFFEYAPVFKLFITGNHRPGLRNVNEAIKSRFVLIPFDVTIPREERDPRLALKLRAEWGGILAWAIQGCVEWQRIGLQPPAVVTKATEEYLASEDLLQNWVDECCDLSSAGYVDALYSSFKAWSEMAGEFVLPRRKFCGVLEDRGFCQDTDKRRGANRDKKYFKGLVLKGGSGQVMP